MHRIMKGVALAGTFVLAMGVAAETASGQTIYSAAELTEQPRVASPTAAQRQIQSAYPRHLQSAGVAGRVVLRLVILADGSVDGATVEVEETPHAGLGEAARAAVRQIRFIPGEVNDQPVATRVDFPITFAVQ